MGRERARPRQYFYFCFALLISVAGCLLQNTSRQRELSDGLIKGNNLLAQNDFDESLKTFSEVWTAARNKPPADVAMYNMGLVYAHPQNPKRDLQKAMYCFDQTIQNNPTSGLAQQARVWIAVLQDSENAHEELEKSRQEVERSKQEAERNRLAIEKSKQDIERSRVELEKSRQEIEKTKQMIEKSKQIDIEIDQKRRERGR
jgi:tetratricopeptide (TPR) repeat protein